VVEHIVRTAPAHLTEGGWCQVLANWAIPTGGDWADRLGDWLDGECDALLLHTSTDDPIETATLWNRELTDRPEAYADALDRWLAYYRELGIERLGYACLVLRKRADGGDAPAVGWVEALQLPRQALRPAGRHVARLFETHDRLAGDAAGRALLDRRLRVADEAVVSRENRFHDGRWHAEAPTLRLDAGLPFTAELDPPTARLLAALDGSQTLGQALAAAVEAVDAREEGLELARRMLEIGFLELADDEDAP
jgi:hypothetical protein